MKARMIIEFDFEQTKIPLKLLRKIFEVNVLPESSVFVLGGKDKQGEYVEDLHQVAINTCEVVNFEIEP